MKHERRVVQIESVIYKCIWREQQGLILCEKGAIDLSRQKPALSGFFTNQL